mmetsp:Transcript_7158/g.14129  ORF Transcript_7158/g.14129 Transcript_7158/m.14129 type:complete len:455 (+) Transcript_7158:72-1436(+)
MEVVNKYVVACLVNSSIGANGGAQVEVRYSAGLLVEFHKFLSLGSNVFGSEPKVLEQGTTRTGRTITIHADLGMRKAVPSVGSGSFDGKGGNITRQDRRLVFVGLFQEFLLAGHGDDTSLDATLGQCRGSLHGGANFGTRRDDNQIRTGFFDGCVGSHDGLLLGRRGNVGESTARAANGSRRRDGFQSNLVGSRRFISVGRTVNVNIRHRTQGFQSFYGLMRGPIFTQTNGIVGENKQDTKLGQSSDTNGTSTVSKEDQKGSTVGTKTSVGKHTIGNGNHGVFTDTKTYVASVVRVLLKVLAASVVGQVGRRQVCRPTHEFRHVGTDSFQTSLAVLTCGLVFVLAGHTHWQFVDDTFGQLVGETTRNFGSLVRVSLGILGKGVFPIGTSIFTIGLAFIPKGLDFGRHVKILVRRQSPGLFGTGQIVDTKRSSVRRMVSLLARASLTNQGLDFDN